jgi:hypothetical protein
VRSIARLDRLVLMALSVAVTPLAAQSGQGAATVPVKVIVRDPTGAPIPNADVRVNAPEAHPTDETGQTIVNLRPGIYELRASFPGFVVSTKQMTVSGGNAQTLEFALPIGAGSGPTVVASDPKTMVQTSSATTTAVVGASNSLSFKVNQEVHALTLGDLQALPQKTVTFHNIHTKADETYTGVPLTDLLAKYGAPTADKLRGKVLSDYIVATGSDGYKAVLSLAETDPSFHPGDVIIADTLDGKPIDKEGPFKLVVTEDKRPARSVHNLVSIELRTTD